MNKTRLSRALDSPCAGIKRCIGSDSLECEVLYVGQGTLHSRTTAAEEEEDEE